jgi:hypothetical protein
MVATARVRQMRVARDACWVIVAAALGVVGLVLLDAAVVLPSWARGLGLAVWVTSVGVLAWRWLWRRWQSEPTLAMPTAQHELPNNLAAAAAATLSLVGCLLAGLLIPGAGEHLRRVALPWQRPTTAPYYVVVTSGEPVVRRGNPVTLSAYAEKRDPQAITPTVALLVVREHGSIGERKLPMFGDGNGAFHITLASVHSNLEYRIQIGTATSDWFHVTAMEAAEVANGSIITIRPPSYAPAAAEQIVPGFSSFKAFQHATALVELRFTRSLATAILQWQPVGGGSELLPLAISSDRLTAHSEFRLIQPGTLRLVTFTDEAGKSLRWETAIAVQVELDQPPRIEQMSGAWVRTLRPGDRLRIAFTATDDIGIRSAVLECSPEPGTVRPRVVPIDLVRTGPARAIGQIELDGLDQARQGIAWRVRLTDSRSLDELQLQPQETVFPETGWIIVRIDATALPQDQQDVVGQRQAIHEPLIGVLSQVRDLVGQIRELDTATAGQTPLPLDQVVRLRSAQERIQQLRSELERCAETAALAPSLRSLAVSIRDTAADPLNRVENLLRGSVTDHPADREARLALARQQLRAIELGLPELIRRNDQLAQVRLAGLQLTNLAATQADLAQRIGPDAKGTVEELVHQQQVLLTQLRQLIAEAEPLRSAVEAAQVIKLRRFCGQIDELGRQLRELDAAIRQLIADERSQLLAEIVKVQNELVQQTTDLLKRCETPARLGNLRLPSVDNLRRISQRMEQGKTLEALTDLQRLAGELEQCATQFQSQAMLRTDPKRAVRDLANWQNDLHSRFRLVAGENATAWGILPEVVQLAIRSEQLALSSALAAVRLPSGDPSIRAIHQNAQEHLAAANRFLAGNGTNADTAMRAAAEYLNQLAEKILTVPERLLKTRGEIEKLRLEQNAIQLAIEQLLRHADPTATGVLARRFVPLLERQRKQLAIFATLDLPTLNTRRVRITAALTAAINDLRDGSPLDAVASQAWVKRELDRLKAVLDGLPAADDKANELARRMKRVKALIGDSPTEMQLKVQSAEVQELRQQLERLQTPESPLLLNEARDAVQSADLAFRNGSKAAEVVRLVAAAATALDRLSDRLTGQESDVDRVRRLAANRRVGADEARKLLGLMPPPGLAGEVSRQLGREIEELIHTRVGLAGQLRKRQVLDQYAKLKDDPTPEKWAGIHAALAEKLDELAAVMVDVGDLVATCDPAPPPEPPSYADAYLPSKQLADAMRDLAQRHQLLHRRLTNLPVDLLTRLQPTPGSALAVLIQKHQELAKVASTVVGQLVTAAQDQAADSAIGSTLMEAAKTLGATERLLLEAATQAARGQFDTAEQTRQEAAGTVAHATTALSKRIPKESGQVLTADLATGEALQMAEGAMRRAVAKLNDHHNLAEAQMAMTTAVELLKKASRALAGP